MLTVALVLANVATVTFSHVCFKRSILGAGARGFLFWQVVGNLAGFLGVLAFTGLLRLTSLHAAYPVVQGLNCIGVQLVGGRLAFGERIPPLAWVGTALVLGGIVLVSL